jgi:hypothetical protein
LKRADPEAYKQHLTTCSDCAEMEQQFANFGSSLRQLAARETCQIDDAERDALLRRASERRQVKIFLGNSKPVWAGAAIAASLIFVVLLGLDYLKSSSETSQGVKEAIEPSSAKSGIPSRDTVDIITGSSAGPTFIYVGTNRLGVSADGVLQILEVNPTSVRVALKRGTVACDVSPLGPKEKFIIEAGEYAVSVIGTRFSVTRTPSEPLSVTVARGTVEVRAEKGALWRVEKNQTIALHLDNRMSSKPASQAGLTQTAQLLPVGKQVTFEREIARTEDLAKSQVDPARSSARNPKSLAEHGASSRVARSIPVWRGWILKGKFAEARHAIESRLAYAPGDGITWSLLADLERKTGNFEAALEAYERTIETADASTANRARYLAATIIQDELHEHARATRLFEEFLATNYNQGQLADIARLKLARSLIALGKVERARPLLLLVVQNQQNTVVGANARRLLNATDN